MQFTNAKNAKSAMETALYGLASGNVDAEEFQEKLAAGLITNENGKYYVDGLEVKSYSGLELEINNFERVSGTRPSNYTEFDNLNTELLNARRNAHKGGK